MEHSVTGDGVQGVVRRNPVDGSVTVRGQVTGLGTVPQKIIYIAAAPVTRGIGFAGSGQPYPNKDIAYSNTPNTGVIDSPDGSFTIELKGIPAGYFSGLGSIYVPPCVDFTCFAAPNEVKGQKKMYHTTLIINETAAPWRWGSGAPAPMRPEPDTPDATGRAMYYFGREELPLFNNQEAQLRARGYPGEMTSRGWPEPDDAKPWAHASPPS
jgi:hypothetical protein